MITLPGVLTVRVINGRNGPFNVGRLVTEIGEFSVKDTLIDEYDEGRFNGFFVLSRIYPTSYFVGGRFVVEIRANLASISLSEVQQPEEAPAEHEIDPLDEAPAPPVNPPNGVGPLPVELSSPESESVPADDEPDVDPNAPEAVFGSLWPLGEVVKLDPTVDRSTFRQQRDWLKENGYRFRALSQDWYQFERETLAA